MKSRSGGFTLIELMLVVTLAALLLGIGVPSFNSFVSGQRVKTAASDFSMAAVQARSEAIKRNAEIGVVSAAGGWKNGWCVIDPTKDCDPTASPQPDAISVQAAYSGLVMTSPNAVTEVVYLSSGRLKDQSTVSSLQISGASGSAVRCVSFDLSGLPKSKVGACS